MSLSSQYDGATMIRRQRIGHNQRQILTTLYAYRERYPGQWVPRYRLNNDLKMGETPFSRAIKRLVEPHYGGNGFSPLVEMTYPSVVYREYQGNVIPLPDNATMSDALFAMKFAWDGSDSRSHFYRITDLGVERLNCLSRWNRPKPRTQASQARDQSVYGPAWHVLTRDI
jgi:hypothetical protein